MDVALATCRELPEPDFDEELLLSALRARGIDARCLAWDDAKATWSAARMCVIRSTWNYIHDHQRFVTWASETARVCSLWNRSPVIRWNAHKAYLLDLAEQGIAVVATRLVRRGSTTRLDKIAPDWRSLVIKPAVAAASYGICRVEPATWAEGEAHLAALLQAHDVLVQPYVASVESYGERALVWIDGLWTHAVRKSPRFAGDEESVSDAVPIAPDERALAEAALAAAVKTTEQDLLYARVDLVRDDSGKPMVSELELIEPSLFLRQESVALARLVDGIAARLGQA